MSKPSDAPASGSAPAQQEAPLTPPMRAALEAHGDLTWNTLRLVAAALTICGLLLGGLNLLLVGSGNNGGDVVLVLAGAIPCLVFAALLAGMGLATRRRCLLDVIGQRYLTIFGETRVVHTSTAAALFSRGRARVYATFDPSRRVVTILNQGTAPPETLQAAVAYTPHTGYAFAIYDERGEEVYRDPTLRASTPKEEATHG